MDENNNQQNQAVEQTANTQSVGSTGTNLPLGYQGSGATGNNPYLSSPVSFQNPAAIPTEDSKTVPVVNPGPAPIGNPNPIENQVASVSSGNTPAAIDPMSVSSSDHKKTIVIISFIALIIVAALIYVMVVLKPNSTMTSPQTSLNAPAVPSVPSSTPVLSQEEQETANVDAGDVDADMQQINTDLQGL